MPSIRPDFFAFFTILSNLFGAALFLALAVRWRSGGSATLDLLRRASVVYLTVSFIVVILVLSGADLHVAIAWVDIVLHKVFPAIVVIDWLLDLPGKHPTYRPSLAWLLFPSVWVGLTLIRGAIDGWYPYPFPDPANRGLVSWSSGRQRLHCGTRCGSAAEGHSEMPFGGSDQGIMTGCGGVAE